MNVTHAGASVPLMPKTKADTSKMLASADEEYSFLLNNIIFQQ